MTIKAEDLQVGYAGVSILDDVSFEVQAGEILIVLGANGAGKTTLLKTLNYSVRPISGEVYINGAPLSSLSRIAIARQIAVVAQESETKFPITIQDFVQAGRFASESSFGWQTERDRAACEAAILDCQLKGFEERQMNQLSGGERQRVVLARALATNAKHLLLDEPGANLDISHQAAMFRLVRRKCSVDGFAAVIITHDLNLAAEFGDRILMLRRNRSCRVGRPEDVLTAENIREVFDADTVIDRHPTSNAVRVTTIF